MNPEIALQAFATAAFVVVMLWLLWGERDE
jgi:hypothetical protein